MRLVGIIERLRFLFLFLVIITVLILKSSQFDFVHRHAANYFFVLLLVYSMWIISHEKRFIWLCITFLCLIELSLIPGLSYYGSDRLFFFRDAVTTCFYLLMFVSCVKFTLYDDQVTITTLFGSLSAYLFLGLFWSYLFQCLMYLDSQSFLGLTNNLPRWDNDFIYYSFVTMTTLGYGDMVPVSAMAKTLSWMAAYAGQAYLTILMAILVAKFVQNQPNR